MSLSNCKFRTLNFLFLVLACFSLIGCKAELSDYDKRISWNYKMTVEVMTPDGIKTGSAVREITIVKKAVSWDDINNKPDYSVRYNLLGEAVIVELSNNNKIFVLLSDGVYSDVLRAFDLQGYDEVAALKKGSKTHLPERNYPKIVTFKDYNDPLSVVLVRGKELEVERNGQVEYVFRDNFEELFGEGVSLQSIMIELTDEDPQQQITNILKWLVKYQDLTLDGQKVHRLNAENVLANSLGGGSFTTFLGDAK